MVAIQRKSGDLAAFLTPRTRVLLMTEHLLGSDLPPPRRPALDEHLTRLFFDRDPSPQLRRDGRRDAGTFRKLPADQLAGRLSRSRSIPRATATAIALMHRAKSEIFASPAESARLSSVALSVTMHGLVGHAMPSAGALALAYHGNALRAAGRLRDATPFFPRARGALPSNAPAWIVGEVAVLEGSFLVDSRKLDVAAVRLSRAAEAFRSAGDDASVARALLKLSACYSTAGRPAVAARVVRDALDLLHPVADARLFLYALHNLCIELVDLDLASTANELFELLRPLYERQSGQHSTLRRLWLESRIARAQGDLDRAEAISRTTLRAFLATELSLEAALVGLDLAGLLLAQQRKSEVIEIAEPLVPVLEEQGLRPEVDQVNLLLRRAAA